VESNLAAYLPGDIPRIGLVHTITPSTYRGAQAIRDYLNATIGVSPRIREDLVRHYGFSADTTFCISNGIECKEFLECSREDASDDRLRILSCGRIEDISKGVFWLPEILKKVRSRGLNVRMTIAGDGPDKSELERRFNSAGLRGITEFRGWVQREELPRLYADHDVFLFPSRFEGLPVGLVEAMAAGCVPVATRIRGVTDFIIEDGRTGLLFPSGDTEAAAHILADVASNPIRLMKMREACRSDAGARFQVRDQARAFASVVEKVVDRRQTIKAALPMNKWEILRGLRPAWWTSLPEPLKNSLRVLRERLPN
jgi:glycosyltransferase involved in cell wall biosynthesis